MLEMVEFVVVIHVTDPKICPSNINSYNICHWLILLSGLF